MTPLRSPDPSASVRIPLLLIVLGLLAVQSQYGICVQDDAYISFRYARNLLDGHGLVFNPGERVEGYTNFLWTLLFVPILAAGLDPTLPAMLLGMAASAALLWSAWEAGGRRWLAPLLIATFPGLSLEGVQGLETAFFAFLLCQALRPGPRWPLWAALAALTRPEGYAVFGLLWLLRPSWRAALAFGALTAPHLLFRLLYYGDIVPNTFHAKAGDPDLLLQGSALERGVRYLRDVFLAASPLFLGCLLLLWPRRASAGWRDEEGGGEMLRAAALLSGFFLLYVVLVGGDFKGTGRFVIPLLGPLALLAQAALWQPLPLRAASAVLAVVWALPGYRQMQDFAEQRTAALFPLQAAARCLEAAVPPGTWVATHAIGLVPYYSGLPTIDMWGLTDRTIARADVGGAGLGSGKAGHERQDYGYVLSRAPALILPGPTLLSSTPTRLSDPPEFGPTFAEMYEPRSLECPGAGSGSDALFFVNVWRRRTP